MAWAEYVAMPEDLVMALLWEHERMTLAAYREMGLVKRPAASKALNEQRQRYLRVYWDIARGLQAV